MEELHKPVLLSEVLESLDPKVGESYLDLTAGYAGHASKILDVTRNYKDSVLVDRDENAARYLCEKYGDQITILNQDFYSAVLQLIECGKTFDLILADFGVSSPQLDREERGFSFSKDGPLDMRMDRRQELTADTIVNKWSERNLAEIFVRYGEEKPGRAKMLAREIVHHRPIKGTKELAEIIAKKSRYSKTHPATQIFQAIRIVVNNELEVIEKLAPGSLISMPGHMMIYLGTEDGKPYVISACGTFVSPAPGSTEALHPNSVILNSLYVRTKSLKTWLDVSTTALTLTPEG